ncbi:MAG: hypothetical protein QOI53_3619 [Verrucomicrobiota bacterium]|jgi:hypothetical protein|nr:hypothetical protein [Verrucomicrobiota bacterium]
MKRNKDMAFVLSVHENILPDISRINLKWNGNHEIFDFDLDRFGKVVNCATETGNTGWVMIEHPRHLKPGDAIPSKPILGIQFWF